MPKHRIFTVGFTLPGDDFENVQFDSDSTLLDADIILYKPTLGSIGGSDSYNGKMLLDQDSSFKVQQRLNHWRSEIIAAVKAGKVLIVYLAKPIDGYRYTGEKKNSGTGRNSVTTNIVTEISSYEAVPYLKAVTPKSGTEIRLEKEARYLIPYWTEFSHMSPYQVEIDGTFTEVLLRSRDGSRALGAGVTINSGVILFLPPIQYDWKVLIRYKKSGETSWTKEALQLGKRVAASVAGLVHALREKAQVTPPPGWIAQSEFRLPEENQLEGEITKCVADITTLQQRKALLEDELLKAGSLRRLLYEQGKPLESAILEALKLFGFEAQPFSDGESEFDSIFVSPEGRCLGEAEGKDNKAINIDKFSQLERNIQEDFAREHVTDYAKGVLFGNAYRLIPPAERGDYFTVKCISAARRVKAALIRTPDLFAPARYLKENPADTEYAARCRDVIYCTQGDIVVFPAVPTAVKTEVGSELGGPTST